MKVARSLLTMTSLMLAAAAASAAATGASADGQGLRDTSAASDHWQGRLSLTSRSASPWTSSLDNGRIGGQRVDSAFALADYYFYAPSSKERTTGFRASGGVGFARRGAAWLGRMPLGANASAVSSDSESGTATFPYVGIGYSGIYPRSGWGFTADVGMMGLANSYGGANGLRVDGSNTGAQLGMDSQIMQMRMRPVVQVGVSYSF